MAETLIEVYRIACYDHGELIGYKTEEGDYTFDEKDIMYFNSREDAEKYLENDDPEDIEDRFKEEIKVVMMSLEEFMTEH